MFITLRLNFFERFIVVVCVPSLVGRFVNYIPHPVITGFTIGIAFTIGAGLSAFAFVTFFLTLLSDTKAMEGILKPTHFRDLGNLMLTFPELQPEDFRPWVSQREATATDLPPRVPQEVADANPLPDEATEAPGSLADIGARLDEILDLSAGVFAPLGEGELAARARWSGVAVDARFRVNRWSSHMREHTVQVEKTLLMIDRPPSEAARLARLVAAAWGRLEAELYMWPAGTPGIADALAQAEEAAAGAAADAASVRASAA